MLLFFQFFFKKERKKNRFTPNTYMFNGHAVTIYKTPRMHCDTVCNNHSQRYVLKKHTVVTDKKILNKSTFVHQMHHTQSVKTLQRYLILVNLSSRVQKEISVPPRVPDTEMTLLVQHSCWKTLQTYLHATHVMTWLSHTHTLCDRIHYQQVPAWSEVWDLLTVHLLAVWSLLFDGQTAHHHGQSWK